MSKPISGKVFDTEIAVRVSVPSPSANLDDELADRMKRDICGSHLQRYCGSVCRFTALFTSAELSGLCVLARVIPSS